MPNEDELKEETEFSKPWTWVIVTFVMVASVSLVNFNSTVLQVSLFQDKQHKPFNGTVMPVSQTPDWVSLSGDEWDYSYDQLAGKLIQTPVYDPSKLAIPVKDLRWGDPEQDMVRNAKITYPVPYMGNYELDGIENVGSHLAVDVKLPKGTPIYSIGNAIVQKVARLSTGFGQHIVLRHDNFPTLSDPTATTTLYSSYSHMGSVLVAEGDVVEKGQKIGLSGESGIATTPHLHFQIDNDLAPWHPFWPFTYAEAVDAGYSFFEAINAGLGRELALANTVNPLAYVQKYLNFEVAPVEDTVAEVKEVVAVEEPVAEVKEVTVVEEPVAEVVSVVVPLTFSFKHDGEFEVGKPEKVSLLIDNLDDYFEDFFNLIVVSEFTGEAEFGKRMFSGIDLVDNNFEFFITPKTTQALRLQAKMGDEVLAISEAMNIRNFTDVSPTHPHSTAIRYLHNQGVITGNPDGTFQPDETVSRVAALKMILSAIQKDLESTDELLFTDVFLDAWYYDYLATAYKGGLVGGYSDKSFKPENTVNGAEFFKILLLAMEVDLAPSNAGDAWYAPYVTFVNDKNLLDDLLPEEGMTRGEVAEAMFRVMILNKTSADKFSVSLVDGVIL